MISNRIIFISPLDWGLGHASRCIPIIQDLQENNKVIIGVSDLNAFFFEKYFPGLQKVEVPSYRISYSENLPIWFKLLLQWPKIRSVIKEENEQLPELISKYKIDLVISDNRYGLYNKSIESVFITHQLNLKAPFSFGIANRINRKFIHHFNEVWVPDYEDKNLRLSGQLSDAKGIYIPVKYIGPQSALAISPELSPAQKTDYLILLSGPEPQRTMLEEILVEKFRSFPGEIVLVRGTHSKTQVRAGNIKICDFSQGSELRDLIVNAETVICRSGYSTLMDLHFLKKKEVILIPTPGQTEQEYLAEYWHKQFGAKFVAQEKINSFNFSVAVLK